jgi:AcrR family transcriptional regulator
MDYAILHIMSAKTPTPRERMIASAALLVRERGARATSIDDVLRHSGAPRGSVYHHFPGGREQLLREATALAGDFVAGRLERADADDPVAAFDAFLARYRADLLEHDFRPGCPVLAIAIESGDGERALQAQAGDVFRDWAARLTVLFERSGIPAGRAESLAVVAISAAEGALALSRAQRDVAPLDSVRAEIGALLERERATTPRKRRTA